MDVYDEVAKVKILAVDVELQDLFAGGGGGNTTSHISSAPLVPKRKDRLLFLGAPPDLAANATSTPKDPRRYLVISNLHWAVNDVDLIDGASAYGAVGGVYIFEDAQRMHKSEGIALLEFRSVSAAESAFKDEGKAWQAKQADRKCVLTPAPQNVVSTLESLSLKYGCWSRTPLLAPAVIAGVWNSLGKPLPATTTMTTTKQNVVDHAKLPVPIAVQLIIDKLANKPT
ncbi:RNA recognition motif (A.K.A RRM, RBD, or RNP domain) protein [Gregarina niphandrodes]|uniref:RNA recognition motif (A.K.A RRM, RBD, or RNP domain) protein n=1 Tax=Gregarina niphandrodes TaxID=110365 RepID=A0A023BBZ5_GRENI|nr:RNA recognition motif (A.K.A RRM, RBD, or RNP domain) protein [Gregarina niphandrodes]EZG81038.1 RNA recognition motif (A.K.A RRM, RBD, or RNP domain) protein [Gregarina niphandrodes]|eukprot:XP_011134277.1 RNA recognition motif (A.K.A RRM, RBD, or RNP domain) protein [Gregarina niphandrodes]